MGICTLHTEASPARGEVREDWTNTLFPMLGLWAMMSCCQESKASWIFGGKDRQKKKQELKTGRHVQSGLWCRAQYVWWKELTSDLLWFCDLAQATSFFNPQVFLLFCLFLSAKWG